MLLTDRRNSLEALYVNPRDESGNRRVRRSATASSMGAQFNGTTFTKKIRLHGQQPLYLKASPNSNSLTAVAHEDNDPTFCFKMYKFQVITTPSTEGGYDVLIEVNDGRFITKDSEGVTLKTDIPPGHTNNIDDRFFRMYKPPGSMHVYLKHLQSGMYLSATQNGVSLHSRTDGLPDSTLFMEVNCTHPYNA